MLKKTYHTFAWSNEGLAILPLCALDTFPVIECVAKTPLDHTISMAE